MTTTPHKQATHTPEWRAEKPPYQNAMRVVDAEGNTIAAVIADPAHARLIAAAPELLDALRGMYAAFEGDDILATFIGGGKIEALKHARAAIAKATGTAP